MKHGISGWLTKVSIRSPLTPLFLMAALLVGTLALANIPREEEPQISVPMVDIHVRADGLRAPDAVELITKPLESVVKAIDGVEHVYSQSRDDSVTVTARFLAGTSSDAAILRVHEKMRANHDRLPLGVAEPLIVGRGIDDVAVVVLTLSPDPAVAERWTGKDLFKVASELRAELVKIDNVGLTYISGGAPEEIRIEPDPEKLSLYGITLQQLVGKISGANRSFMAGQVRGDGGILNVISGQTLAGVPDIGLLLLTTREGRPVYVRDVATVVIGEKPQEQRAWAFYPLSGSAAEGGAWGKVPAVSLALAKRAGSNAVVVSQDILDRVNVLQGTLIPDGLRIDVTRDYGATANEKANELLFHLLLATISIVGLIAFAIGRREAAVTLVIIPTTILLTLFAADMMGYTINRVSLFALIFSIGILVDDAIVMIENIARHWAMNDGRARVDAAVDAVAEVGNPTIVATLTVVTALLPMLFVSGLMGPYMAPIPVNASAAMLFSFFIAVIVAPWLMVRFAAVNRTGGLQDRHSSDGALGRLYRRMATPVIRSSKSAFIFLTGIGVATLLSFILFFTRDVTVKLLPFDNKSEFQIVLDMPEGASIEATEQVLDRAADQLKALPEVVSMQSYVGTAAPFNFNGLVRHYYLRESSELGDLQVNLLPKQDRKRTSHDIALAARALLKDMALPAGVSLKVVEVPPGPPVLSTVLAEIYGPDAQTRRETVTVMKKIFSSVPYVVDVDDSVGQPRPRLHMAIDQERLEFFKVEQQDVYDTVQALLGGVAVGYSHRGEGRDPVEVTIRLPKADKVWTEYLASTPVPANTMPGDKTIVELGDVVRVTQEEGSPQIFRHNGYSTDMVMADLAGAFEAPVYAMLDISKGIAAYDWAAEGLQKPEISYHGQPADESRTSLLWDGEWEITFVTFRDMGIAFGVALLGIYVLVVAQFRSFKLPLVILTPVPLTFIGIILGHWIFSTPFSATSMIGFIALSGIIVRNSILLVDFIQHGRAKGLPLNEVLMEAGTIRFKPIMLTALAAMIGAITILADPIFQGLAISLLFGLASSTLLTVLVIPAIYTIFVRK